jgi:3-oxoacyl-[acyl-carrier-protein] synthase-3
MLRSRVIGTGSYLPPNVLTNSELEKMTDTSDEWIRQRTGIHQRHIASEGQATSDLGAEAARAALSAAGIAPGEVDCVICATMTADYLFPSSACLIQRAIGANGCAAYDVNAACSGFIYGLSMADAYIRAGIYRTVLLVGADLMSNRLVWEKRDTAVLFGDGAGAVVLRGDEGDAGVLTTHMAADGEHYDLLYLPAGGSKKVVNRHTLDGMDLAIVMSGRDLYKKAIAAFSDAALKALDATGATVADIALFVPHQANTRIIYAVSDKLEIPREKVYVNIQHAANTVAATIPIALDEAAAEGRLKPGDLALLVAFGAGLTWASAMVRW